MFSFVSIKRLLARIRVEFNQGIRFIAVVVFGLNLASCEVNKTNQGSLEFRTQEKVAAQNASVQQNVESMLNNGLQENLVAINEVIIINESEKLIKWRLSLGRKDFKSAKINTFDNKVQKSVQMTKAGRYQVTIESVNNTGHGPVMKHGVIIVVE